MAEKKSNLQRAYEALAAKKTVYDTLWKYYDGDHPLVYSTERLREVFRSLDARFVQNWCAVVIDAAIDRINLTRFQVANNENADTRLHQIFLDTELNLDSDDAHLAALVTGEAFIIAWKNENGEIEAFYNDPRLCHIEYDPENPRKKLWAAKWWINEAGGYSLTLYYEDRLEYYVTTKKAQNVTNYKAFEPAETDKAENPYGIIPVFHLRRERRKIASELVNATPIQNAVNKLLADMMVAAEFGAFKQRWIISQADTGNLKNAPNEIWSIPAGDGTGQQSSVGEFSETTLENFWQTIDELARSIGIITRTPKHYFYAQGGDPSGEALIALEAPLNKKCSRYIERFTRTWQKIGEFLMLLDGEQIPEADITPLFDRPETVQPKTAAEIREINSRSGIPLATSLREEGRSESEIEQVQKDKIEEQAASQSSLARALLEQQRQFDQGSQDGQQAA